MSIRHMVLSVGEVRARWCGWEAIVVVIPRAAQNDESQMQCAAATAAASASCVVSEDSEGGNLATLLHFATASDPTCKISPEYGAERTMEIGYSQILLSVEGAVMHTQSSVFFGCTDLTTVRCCWFLRTTSWSCEDSYSIFRIAGVHLRNTPLAYSMRIYLDSVA